MLRINCYCISLLYFICLPLQAADAAADRIRIQADSMSMDINSGISTYSGNVRFEKHDIALSGDRIIINENKNGQMTVRVNGTPARYEQNSGNETTRAESSNMQFDNSSGVLTMNTSARLEQNSQVIESEMIEFDTQRKVLLAGGNKPGGNSRVNIILNQQAGQR